MGLRLCVNSTSPTPRLSLWKLFSRPLLKLIIEINPILPLRRGDFQPEVGSARIKCWIIAMRQSYISSTVTLQNLGRHSITVEDKTLNATMNSVISHKISQARPCARSSKVSARTETCDALEGESESRVQGLGYSLWGP